MVIFMVYHDISYYFRTDTNVFFFFEPFCLDNKLGHWRPCLSKHLCHQTTSKNLNPYFVHLFYAILSVTRLKHDAIRIYIYIDVACYIYIYIYIYIINIYSKGIYMYNKGMYTMVISKIYIV